MALATTGQTISGAVTVQATATDDSGTVASMAFFIGGSSVPACTDAVAKLSGATFSCLMDTTTAADGLVNLRTNATDPSGNTSPDTVITVTINNVTLPTVSIVASDPTATEAGPTGGVFTVTRSGDLSAPLTVFYTVAGTATPSVDYAALSGSVTIVATQASAAINVDPLDDADVEPDETVVAALAADAAYTIGAPAQGAVTIVSDDGGVPLPVDKAEWKGDVVEVEGRGAPGAAEVQVGIVGTSILLGTVVAEADGKWRLSQNRAPNEVPCEVNARTGGGAFDAATAVRNAPANCIPQPTLPTVSIAASDPTATEAGPTGGVFTVTRSGDLSAPLTVFYTVAGTATPSIDYAALSGSVIIVATQASAAINVDPLDDADVEPDETVNVDPLRRSRPMPPTPSVPRHRAPSPS